MLPGMVEFAGWFEINFVPLFLPTSFCVGFLSLLDLYLQRFSQLLHSVQETIVL